MKKLLPLILVSLFLTSCTLSFRLKGYVYNHLITQMEKDYLAKAKATLGEAPAVSVYAAGLKKYNRIQGVTQLSLGDTEATFQVDKVMLDAQFAEIFLNFLIAQAKEHPTRKAEDVLKEFTDKHPEPWPTEAYKTKLIVNKTQDQWVVSSESRI